MMTGSSDSHLLPTSVLRNLCDKMYEKRKSAALVVEQTTKQMAAAKDWTRVVALISLLANDFAASVQANNRKGGLIGLAAVTVALAGDAEPYLASIVPPVLKAFTDQDSRVRYYACEALYNIAKVARNSFIMFFNEVFDALCRLSADSDASVQNAAHLLDRLVKDIVTESPSFSIENFIPMLRERLIVLNPYVRQFLVGWITVLDSVPDIDMLEFLPDFLDGLLNMLSDPNREIRQQADSALTEFLQEIKSTFNVDYGRLSQILVSRAGENNEFTRLTAITWLHEFVSLGGPQLYPYIAEVLAVILPCLSHPEERIQQVALQTNEELVKLMENDTSENVDVPALLTVVRKEMGSGEEATRLRAVRWVSSLLLHSREQVLSQQQPILGALLATFADVSDQVVEQSLEVVAGLAQEETHFQVVISSLVQGFRSAPALLQRRGRLVVRRLCSLLGAQRVYMHFATILQEEEEVMFAREVVQVLNLILLTCEETAQLCQLLSKSLHTPEGRDLLIALYASWCHCSMATVSLCLLSKAYRHAYNIITCLDSQSGPRLVDLLVQADNLVALLEGPGFTSLRLQLLRPVECPDLVLALYGLLMLLPQSPAFQTLQTRLSAVQTLLTLHQSSSALTPTSLANTTRSGSRNDSTTTEASSCITEEQFALMLDQFHEMRMRHAKDYELREHTNNSKTSSISNHHILHSSVHPSEHDTDNANILGSR